MQAENGDVILLALVNAKVDKAAKVVVDDDREPEVAIEIDVVWLHNIIKISLFIVILILIKLLLFKFCRKSIVLWRHLD